MKDDCDRLFERAFQAWIGPEIAWFERSQIVLGGLWVFLKLE